jgi:hypothetical protein
MLVLPRSFSSLIGSMLGQHPQMYALPETHLFGCNSVAEWADRASRQSFNMSHGLFRAVAQLRFGAQDECAVVQARGWLKRRPELTTGFLLELLAEMVSPRVLIEKSPSLVYSIPAMQQSYTMFPLARYIHVVQHPCSYGEAVMNAISDAARSGPVPKWMVELGCYPASSPVDGDLHQRTPMLDPQTGWYALNMNVCSFLESVPESQKMRVRGEEVLAVPDTILLRIANWIGVAADADAIEQMKHPERSPYARLGPPSARYGNDHEFLAHPQFTPASSASRPLDGPLPWAPDQMELSLQVLELARRFGYE